MGNSKMVPGYRRNERQTAPLLNKKNAFHPPARLRFLGHKAPTRKGWGRISRNLIYFNIHLARCWTQNNATSHLPFPSLSSLGSPSTSPHLLVTLNSFNHLVDPRSLPYLWYVDKDFLEINYIYYSGLRGYLFMLI